MTHETQAPAQSPQTIATEIRANWDAERGAPRELQLKLELAIARAIQAERDRHAAEVAQVRRETRIEDAKAICPLCADQVGLKAMNGGTFWWHEGHDAAGKWASRQCSANNIQTLIAKEAANER